MYILTRMRSTDRDFCTCFCDIMQYMYKIIDIVFSIFYPRRCLGCKKIGRYLCVSCVESLKSIHSPICPICARPAFDGQTHPRCKTKYSIDGLISAYRYSGPLRKGIKLLKYSRVRDIAPVLGDLVVQKLHGRELEIVQRSVIIPIPLHWTHQRRRWFNQSELIAQEIAKTLGFQVNTKLLIRSKQKQSQTTLKKADRLKNMKGAFAIAQEKSLKVPNSIVLLDDVWTTGATSREAASVLKRAGVKKVWALTVVR